MKTASRFPAAFLVAAALLVALLAVPALAQEDSGLDANMQAALHDLSELYGSPVVRIDQARAICNQEQYMVECAAIGKKHGLFGKERESEVDSILTKMKGRVVEELKQCGSTECLITVAAKIAKELSAANPTLARTVDLTPQDVQKKRSIVEVSKEVGVDFEECRTMDPDTAPVDLLRACAKLAKHERIREYIPEEHRMNVEKTEKTADLKEALASGQIQCGDGTLEGCGTFCLNPTAAQREEGLAAIPPICRQIAEQFFGPEGVGELERTHSTVRKTYDEVREIYKEREENPDDIPPFMRAKPLPGVTCPAPENTPCPPGQYRQGSVNELGCYVRSACIPFNTETQPEKKEGDKAVICPAMPTVDSCRANEEKVVAFSSPECGTYYTCRPKPEVRTTKFPFTFKSGRAVVSFDEARIYCYESGSRGATARGDKEECLNAFGITVPDISPEKQCKEYGEGWHTMDGSGNCFNPNMDEYRTPGGTPQRCAVTPVYGCKTMDEPGEPPSGQKEQIWNSLGLRSWIRADASGSRIASLKEACANVAKTANVWLPEAGTSSSGDFGMPDPEKCKKAATCKATEYFNGSECSSTSRQCGDEEYWNGSMCVTATSTPPWGGGMKRCFYPNASINNKHPGYTVWCESDYVNCHEGSPSGASVSLTGLQLGAPSSCESWSEQKSCYSIGSDASACKTAGCTWYADHFDGSHCDDAAHGQSRPTCPAGDYWDGSVCKSKGPTVSGSCSSDIKSLLGSGCHSMGNAWFNGTMTLYILPASTMMRSCSSEKISGCGGSHADVSCPSGQWWNGSSCVSSEGTICGSNEYWDAGKGMCMSSGRACAQAGGSWDSARNYCEMPQAKQPTGTTQTQTGANVGTAGACTSGQYWNGSGCVSSSGGGGASSMKRCFYPNASVNGKHPGYTVWCEADYYNCHVGEPSGASVSLSGLSLGAPSSCESGWSGGSSGSGRMQSWNGYGLSSMVREDADPARIASLKQACGGVKSSSANVWMASAGTYTSPDFGMPDPDKCAKAASCAEGQYFNGSTCGSSSSGGGSSGSGCYTYTSQTSCQATSGCYWIISSGGSPYCSDYAGDSGGGYAGYSSGSGSCGSGLYWNGSACAPSGGGGCNTSTEYWDSATQSCKPVASSGSGGYSSGCSSTEYWDSGTQSCKPMSSSGTGSSGSTDYSHMQSDCASAGGTWDSSSNYCRMSSGSLQNSFAYLCPAGHLWNGSYCIVAKERADSFLANVLQAFLALFGK